MQTLPRKQVPPPLYRLTLSREAYAVCLARSKPLARFAAVPNYRTGWWDVYVPLAIADLLKQLAEPNECLSDTVIRVLSKKEIAR